MKGGMLLNRFNLYPLQNRYWAGSQLLRGHKKLYIPALNALCPATDKDSEVSKIQLEAWQEFPLADRNANCFFLHLYFEIQSTFIKHQKPFQAHTPSLS